MGERLEVGSQFRGLPMHQVRSARKVTKGQELRE